LSRGWTQINSDEPFYITVPDKPGLGVTLNEAVVKQHLLEPGYFEPTPQWNTDRSNDRLWS